jgi:hypothetical protein
MNELFLNKQIKLIKQDGFVLYGKLISIEQYGVYLQTPQKTSFIAFANVKEISLDERGGY